MIDRKQHVLADADGVRVDEPPIDDLVMARAGILTTQPGFRPGPVHVVHPLPSVGAALLESGDLVAYVESFH